MHRPLVTRIATLFASAAAVAAVVVPGTAATEMASPPPKAHGSARSEVASVTTMKYVALGSSYVAGPGKGPLADRRCYRARNDYPHQVAAARHLRLVDVTCSGSTTANILRKPQRSRARRPQIDAVTPDTGLVTITTGGNDLDYVGRLTSISCMNVTGGQPGRTAEAVDSSDEQPSPDLASHCGKRHRHIPPEPTVRDYLRLEEALVDIIGEVRVRAPHARIVVVDYLPLINQGGGACKLIPVNAEQAAETVRVYNGLVNATDQAAQITGAQLIAASRNGAGHTPCSAQPWVRGFQFPVPYHPNDEGKAAVANMVLAALHR